MSKIGSILEVIKGQHVFSNTPADGLRDYYRASDVVKANRIRLYSARLIEIKRLLHPYNVAVSFGEECILIHAHDTGKETRI